MRFLLTNVEKVFSIYICCLLFYKLIYYNFPSSLLLATQALTPSIMHLSNPNSSILSSAAIVVPPYKRSIDSKVSILIPEFKKDSALPFIVCAKSLNATSLSNPIFSPSFAITFAI